MLTEKSFNKLVGRIARVATLLDADIQDCAIYAIHQSIEHRNSTPANGLFQAVRKVKGMMRADSLAHYFEQHGNLAYMSEGKTIAFFEVKDRTFDESVLEVLPWRMAIAPVEAKSQWDVKELLSELVDRMEKKLSKNEGEVLNKQMLVEIKAIVAKGAVSA